MFEQERALCEAKSKILKALAHPTRLWMVEQLRAEERCVCQFADEISADFSTVSKHLAVLREAGIVAHEKRGKQVFYRLKMACVMDLLGCVEGVIREQATAQTALVK
jgi:DNA-binding transcriptional ArsR family regulator